ncbi:MAG TPA: aminoglycoside phosphotransferase family protein [Actinomycetota bacterium]
MSEPYDDFVAATRARIGDGVEGWLDGLSELIAELVARWDLSLGDPLPGGAIGYTVAAVRGGSDPVVLKVTYPDGWFPEEVAALLAWDGRGAVELIDHDPRGATLLERAVPGTSLLDDAYEQRAMMLAAAVLERLWIHDPGGVTTVEQEAGRWADTLVERNDWHGRPVAPGLVDEAVGVLRELVPSQREARLLHGDLHLGNVLSAARERWLAIDPKPLVGEREFDVTALVRDKQPELLEDRDAPARLQRRFDRLSDRLGCDRGRLRGWSIAVMVDYAVGCFEEGDEELGRAQARVAELLRSLRV